MNFYLRHAKATLNQNYKFTTQSYSNSNTTLQMAYQLHINHTSLVSPTSLSLSILFQSHNITHYTLIQRSRYDLFHYSNGYLNGYDLPFSGLALSTLYLLLGALVSRRATLQSSYDLSALVFTHVFSSGKLSTEWQEEVFFPRLSSLFIGPKLSSQHSYRSCLIHPCK